MLDVKSCTPNFMEFRKTERYPFHVCILESYHFYLGGGDAYGNDSKLCGIIYMHLYNSYTKNETTNPLIPSKHNII